MEHSQEPIAPDIETVEHAVLHELESGYISYDEARDLFTDYATGFDKPQVELALSQMQRHASIHSLAMGAFVERRVILEQANHHGDVIPPPEPRQLRLDYE